MPIASLARVPAFAKAPRFRKTALWIAGLFVGFGVIGFLAAPPLARSLLEEKLGESLHRQVSIESLSLNPYALSAEITGLSVKAGEDREQAGFDRLYVNLEASSLFRGGPVIREVRLENPRVHIARLDEGRYDISDLLEEWSKPSDSPTPRFAVSNIQVTGGKAVFEDKPAGVVHTVDDLTLGLPFFSSLPYQAEIAVEPRFSAVINGAPLVLEGRTKPFADSHESELSLDLDQVDLVRYLPYSPVRLPFTVRSGALYTELKLLFRQPRDEPAVLQLVGAIHIKDLAATEKGGQPLIAWKALDVSIREADLLNRRIALDKVRLAGLENHARVSPEGNLNWLDVAEALAPPQPARRNTEEKSRPLDWSVDELQVEDATQHWRDESRGKPFTATIRDLHLDARHLDSSLAKPLDVNAAWSLDAAPSLRLSHGKVKGGRIDLAHRSADLGELTLKGAEIGLVRDRKGVLDLPQPPRLKSGGAESAADDAPWIVSADHLALADSTIRYEDQGMPDKSVQVIDGINASLDGFSTAEGRKATVALAARVNQRGGIKVGGNVQLKPLSTNLDLDISGFPLLPIQPYFAERLNLTLTRGQISGKGNLSLQDGKDGLGGGFKGQVTLGDLNSIDKTSSADFLRWKSLFVGNVDARLQPFALSVGEVALTDFYARVIVSPEGRLNLMQIVRKPENPPPAPEKVATAPAPAKEVTPIRVDKISLQGGTINFSDYFVKPNYTVNVTRIGGRLNGLSSAANSLADLELRGSYGSSAPVEVRAKLNPLAAKTYLDLKGEIRGVDLTTLSAYSGKYAGYAISEGKLSLYVTYKLDRNQLTADNRVFLDRLTFGDRINSPEATTLPVKLAVALLKNGRGEIDVNLPISGSIDDPQFSLGGVIMRVIGNLFVKAVSSPFALLGSMFGGGEELSNLEFDAGRATLDQPAVKRLEALAKAMADRPALKLEITGRVDPESDREGLKRVALERAVKVEKLKDLQKKGIEVGSADALEVSTQEYPGYLQRAYREAKFPKPRNLVGLQKDLPVEEMEKLMLANQTVGEDDLRQLGVRRAEAAQAWLTEHGKVALERLFLLAPKLGGERPSGDKARPTRVEFSLR